MEHETLEPNWTTVDRFFHPTDAHIAAGKLKSEGIPVFLFSVFPGDGDPVVAIAKPAALIGKRLEATSMGQCLLMAGSSRPSILT